ncbi:hypothetical protein FUA23_16945 [Neolewinella aurantiaca]|uniref:SEC-C motif-containing protein n=2 Tax=Neolewinella aurantiaca TaxID=2602767 RepID=A0A5C7FAU6_9BACT|nr:hypothetical protein FUA23_16945 [Neolewinella aurantiaca]
MITALVEHDRLPEAIRRFSRLVGFAPKEKFVQLLAEEIVRKKIDHQIKSVRKIPASNCIDCWPEATPPAVRLLDDAYRDHISYLKSELKKKGLAVAPEPVRQKGTKISRNAPCPCGSNKKYKRCCGR